MDEQKQKISELKRRLKNEQCLTELQKKISLETLQESQCTATRILKLDVDSENRKTVIDEHYTFHFLRF